MRTRRSVLWWCLVLSVQVGGCASVRAPQAASPAAQPPVCSVYFSPRGGCTEHIVRVLQGARRRVLVQAYSFTSEPIAQALAQAAGRGVEVDILVDTSQQTAQHTAADELVAAGVPVRLDAAHAIAHNKIMIVDGETVITGSFNFTDAAEKRNAENLLIIRDAGLAAAYEENWRAHRSHSRPFRVSQEREQQGASHALR